jgi:phage-related protein
MVFSGVSSFFTGIFNKIKSIFTNIGKSIGNAVSGAFKNAVNWILSKAIGIINGFIGAINTAISIINKIPGVSLNKLDKLDTPQMEEGGVLERGQVGILEGNGAEAVVPLEKNHKWISAVAKDMDAEFGGKSSSEKMDKIIALLQTLIELVPGLMDGMRLEINKREFGRVVRQVIV